MIKLEFDANNTVLMKHLGQALQSAAFELNGEDVTQSKRYGKSVLETAMDNLNSITLTDEGANNLDEGLENPPVIKMKSSDTIDANGFPWDARIHSSSKKRNKDDTWKMVRGLDDDTRAEVEAELKALMSIPVVEAKQDESMPNTPFDNEKFEEAMKVVNETEELAAQGAHVPEVGNASQPETVEVPKPQEATSHVAPPPPPPVVEAPATAGTTLGDVEAVDTKTITRYITGVVIKEKGYTVPEINGMLKEQYDLAFATLATRPELLPQIYTMLQELPTK